MCNGNTEALSYKLWRYISHLCRALKIKNWFEKKKKFKALLDKIESKQKIKSFQK